MKKTFYILGFIPVLSTVTYIILSLAFGFFDFSNWPVWITLLSVFLLAWDTNNLLRHLRRKHLYKYNKFKPDPDKLVRELGEMFPEYNVFKYKAQLRNDPKENFVKTDPLVKLVVRDQENNTILSIPVPESFYTVEDIKEILLKEYQF